MGGLEYKNPPHGVIEILAPPHGLPNRWVGMQKPNPWGLTERSTYDIVCCVLEKTCTGSVDIAGIERILIAIFDQSGALDTQNLGST